MKKILLGAIVGGLLLFIWQTLSWMVMDLHSKAHSYTEKQTAILNVLNSELTEEGQFLVPGYKPGGTSAEHEAVMKENTGKPWALISYHKSFDMPLASNIIRGLLVDILLMALFSWILSKLAIHKFGTVFAASLCTGLIVFLNSVYTGHIWYPTFDLMAHLTDAIVGWGLAGLWLGWWFARK